MQSIFVFLDIKKLPIFRWKTADVGRTGCPVIYIFSESILGKVKLYQVSSLYVMCDKF